MSEEESTAHCHIVPMDFSNGSIAAFTYAENNVFGPANEDDILVLLHVVDNDHLNAYVKNHREYRPNDDENRSNDNTDNHRENRSNDNTDNHRENRSNDNTDNHRENRSNDNTDNHRENRSNDNTDSHRENRSNDNTDNHRENRSSDNTDNHRENRSSDNHNLCANISDNPGYKKSDEKTQKSNVDFSVEDMKASIVSDRKARFASYVDELRRKGIKSRVIVEFGEPRDTILKCSEDLKASNIIIGSRGLGVVQRLFIGSVAEYVVAHAHCHVIVARSGFSGDIRR